MLGWVRSACFGDLGWPCYSALYLSELVAKSDLPFSLFLAIVKQCLSPPCAGSCSHVSGPWFIVPKGYAELSAVLASCLLPA